MGLVGELDLLFIRGSRWLSRAKTREGKSGIAEPQLHRRLNQMKDRGQIPGR